MIITILLGIILIITSLVYIYVVIKDIKYYEEIEQEINKDKVYPETKKNSKQS